MPIIRKRIFQFKVINETFGDDKEFIMKFFRNRISYRFEGTRLKAGQELEEWVASYPVGIICVHEQPSEKFYELSFELEADMALFLLRFS